MLDILIPALSILGCLAMAWFPCCLGCQSGCKGVTPSQLTIEFSGLNATLDGTPYVLTPVVSPWYVPYTGCAFRYIFPAGTCGATYGMALEAAVYKSGATYYAEVTLGWDCDGWSPSDFITWRFTFPSRPDCRGIDEDATYVGAGGLCGSCDWSTRGTSTANVKSPG